MIEYLKGTLAFLAPTEAVVDVGGVGYGMQITLNTYTAVQGKKDVQLWVHEAIREDAYQLFGFASKRERELFRLLIGVSGVGAGTARMVLSSLSAAELCNAISQGDERLIKGVKGIGLKTAQRIIVDLRDQIVRLGIQSELPAGSQMGAPVNNEVKDEAIGALTMLGFAPAPTQKVVVELLREKPGAAVEEIIKMALKKL